MFSRDSVEDRVRLGAGRMRNRAREGARGRGFSVAGARMGVRFRVDSRACARGCVRARLSFCFYFIFWKIN